MRRMILIDVIVMAVLLASPCFGWGPDGHRIIGDIATRYLSPKARAAIKDLLGDQSLADVSTWADEVRKDSAYDYLKPLHYINVPRNAAKVDMARDCKNEQCVIGAINHYTAVLKNRQSTRDERVTALKLLVHFVGDVHQPLHVSYEDDRGANWVKAQFFDQGEKNLHAIWDESLIDHRMHASGPPGGPPGGSAGGSGGEREAFEKDLFRRLTEKKLKEWRGVTSPVEWANESLAITRRLYKDVPGQAQVQGQGQLMQIGEAYFEKNIGTVEDRLTAAGVRLAALLNTIFGDEKPTTRPSTKVRVQTDGAESEPTTAPAAGPPDVPDAPGPPEPQ